MRRRSRRGGQRLRRRNGCRGYGRRRRRDCCRFGGCCWRRRQGRKERHVQRASGPNIDRTPQTVGVLKLSNSHTQNPAQGEQAITPANDVRHPACRRPAWDSSRRLDGDGCRRRRRDVGYVKDDLRPQGVRQQAVGTGKFLGAGAISLSQSLQGITGLHHYRRPPLRRRAAGGRGRESGGCGGRRRDRRGESRLARKGSRYGCNGRC